MSDTIKNFVASILRHILSGVGAFLVSKGFLIESQVANFTEIVIGAVLGLLALAWSFFSKKKETVKLQKAIAAPEGQAE